MAYDLVARLSVKDDFSRNMRKFQKQTEQLNKIAKTAQRSTDDWTQSTNKLSNRLGRLSNDSKRAFQGISRGADVGRMSVGKLTGAFVALGAAIGGVKAAQNLFDKTIGAAAQYEQSEVTIKAMFRDNAKANDFMTRMEKLALDSPLLNSQDIFGNAKSFISFTKDVGQLERLFKISERLAASNPLEGTSGSVYAMAEMLSGDGQSIADRFRLPRSVVNEIKKLPIESQIKALDKLLDKMGFTEDLVKQMGDTSLGLWNQIKEKSDVVLRTMGQPALSKIRDFLDRLNTQMENGDKSGFIKFGQDTLSALADGFINGVTGLSKMINGIVNDPKFINANGMGGKAQYLLDKFNEGLNAWLNGGGREKLENITKTLVNSMVQSIEKNAAPIAQKALSLGWTIGSEMARGIASAIEDNPLAKAALGGAAGGAIGGVPGAVVGGSASLTKHYLDKFYNVLTPWDDKKLKEKAMDKVKGSHSAGLSRVPYDGYTAVLHKNERVLTAEENRAYSNGGGKPITINIAKMEVRNDSDIQKIGYALFKQIESAYGA